MDPVGGPPIKVMKTEHGRKGGGKKGDKGKDGHAGIGPIGKYVFKVLCTDPLAANVIGRGGDSRAELEQATNCSVWISKREELFPEPSMRLLVLHAATKEAVQGALQRLVPKLIEVAERDRQVGEDLSLLGKEDGEYVFYCCLPVSVRGRLIAAKGKEISGVRDKSGAKIFVENDSHSDHCSARVIGRASNLEIALEILNGFVQDESGTPAFLDWAETRPFNNGKGSGGPRPGKGLRPRNDPRGGRARSRDRDDHGHKGERHRDGGSPTGNPPPEIDEQDLSRFIDEVPTGSPTTVMEALAEIWQGSELEMDHEIRCDLPTFMAENDGFHRFIEDRTATRIVMEPAADDSGLLSFRVSGPLLSTYFAHFLIMKKYHEDEKKKKAAEEAAVEAQPSNVNDLKDQIAKLQAQLAAAQGSPAGTPAAGPPGAMAPRGQWGSQGSVLRPKAES